MKHILALILVLFAATVGAQSLSDQQITTLRAAVCSDAGAKALNNAQDTAGLRTYLNASATPSFTVWKSSVTIRETGQAFIGSEWAGMTSANHTRLQTVAQYLASYNPAITGIRAMFDDIWSGAGGTQTRAALLALWKRLATRAEKALATGTGSDAVPAALGFEGAISSVDTARTVFNDNGTAVVCP